MAAPSNPSRDRRNILGMVISFPWWFAIVLSRPCQAVSVGTVPLRHPGSIPWLFEIGQTQLVQAAVALINSGRRMFTGPG